ncbi:MAG: 2-hydroxyacyl-CoA dehydratase family protein [Pseudomonadota bacterium]
MDIFYDAATKVQNKPILEWKKAGKKVVGYTCSYVPAEIFDAADILPVRLRGIETDGMEIGDSYYGPFICSFPKCILQLAGKGMFNFMDGAIITPGCDAMRRLDECWRKAGENHEGIVPSYFYYFDVPHKTEPHGMRWFVQEIRNLIISVEAHFDVRITDNQLKASIIKYNKSRRLLKTIEELRAETNVRVTGTEVFAATVAGTVMPRDEFTDALENWLETLKQKKNFRNGLKRLMLVGSISDEINLVELIEKNTDAVVVAENLCFGVRFEGNEIPEDGDPVESLARHYLGKSLCPRMFGKYQERLSFLKGKIKQARVNGVVLQNIRFCDLHGAENALFERDLEALGIPCLRIEREYGPLTETGRMKLRINAFLERIS